MAAPARRDRPVAPSPWPFVGREDELEWVSALRSGGSCGVVVSGPPGVGKTRLAREVLAAAALEGAASEWVQATQAVASIPLGAFASLVPAGVQADDRLQVFQLCAQALAERSQSQPLVLGVDDAHLLDPNSAALVLHLATRGTAFVVVTVRAGERCPDSIVALWKDLEAPRLELQQLSEAETGQLLEAVLDGEVDPSVKRWAFGASDGHVLYLRELVKGSLANGDLLQDDGLWKLRAQPAVTAALAELVSAALGDLGPEELDAVRLLALGEPLELDTATEITGLEPVRALEEKGLVHVVLSAKPTGRTEVRLAHPLYGEVVRAGTPNLRGLELRRQLAGAVRARGLDRPGDALRVAAWLDDANEHLDDVLLLAAARDAVAAGDADLAERLALRASPGLERSLALAAAHVQRGRFEEAEALLAEWNAEGASRELALEYLERRALRVLHFGLVRSEDALKLLADAAGWFGDADWTARLEMMRLQVSISGAGGGPTGAADGLERLLEREDLPQDVRRRASIALAMSLWRAGRTSEALAASASLRPSLPLRDADDANALVIWWDIRQLGGYEWPAVERWLDEADRGSSRANVLTRGEVLTLLAYLALEQGRTTTATRKAREAIEILERFDTVRRLPLAKLTLATSTAQSGDVEGSRRALAGYESSIGDVPRPYWRLQREEVIAHAALALAEGEIRRAIDLLLEASASVEQPVERARLLYEALRAGADPQAVVSDLEAAARACGTPLAELFARQAAAQEAGDANGLLETAEGIAAIGAWLWAAECAARAARVFEEAGREDSARRATARSGRFLENCDEGVSSPVLAAVELAPAGLTRRESEIVTLAAAGASNAEIAERLVLSVRTVESHLYRAMQKLGVASRHELSAD